MADSIEQQTQEFLQQCVAEGRMTQQEYDDVRLGRESSGCVRPPWKEWDVCVPLGQQLSQQDCEVYINYPAWPMTDIARRLGVTIGVVRAALARVRRVLPSLRNDPSGNQGLPSLCDMLSLDAADYEHDLEKARVKF